MMRHRIFATVGMALALAWSSAYAKDAAGMKELGVDISKAGTTKQENQQFMNSLSREQQAKVREQCLVQLVEPVENHPAVVVAFCKNLQQT
jgi:hypothetical protein